MIRTEVAKALGALGRRLAPNAPVILIYHRVSPPERDVWGITVSPERFAEQVEAIKRVRRVLSLGELVAAVREGRGTSQRLAAITFDDGYQDVATLAQPILDRLDCPATVFVASGLVDRPQEFWWDELAFIFLGPHELPGELELKVRGRIRRWSLAPDNVGARRRACHEVRRLLRNLRPQAIEACLATFRLWAGVERPARQEVRLMTSRQIAGLRSGPIEVGAHTVRHPRLPSLERREQVAEIERSRRDLAEIAGAAVDHFAYPFGDYDGRSIAAVQSAGFASACTTVPGVVGAGASRFRLPRIAPGQAGGEEMLQAFG